VANNLGNSVTELDASTGALVRVISASIYRLAGPDAMAVSGCHDLFAANGGGNWVIELDTSTGALVRVISPPI
jgi:hypothetical protein